MMVRLLFVFFWASFGREFLTKCLVADIAISAPYENNGVVYLYFGSSEGLNQENCQKITPSGYSGRGFGYSISNGADYDRNGLNGKTIFFCLRGSSY